MDTTDTKLFSTLDDVPWADLTHAYGSAADIPDHFRLLLSPDPEVRDGIFDNLYGNLFHQGSVYPATVAAIPFFIEAAGHPAVPDRARILVYLAHLATGYPEDCVLRGFDVTVMLALGNPLRPRPQKETEDDEDENEFNPEYGDLMRQCYAAIGAGCPVYAGLLGETSAGLRHAAAFLLAWFPAHAWGTVPTLLRLAQDDASPLVRCGSLLALSYLAGPTTRTTFLHLADSMVTTTSAAHVAGTPVPALDLAACYCLLREKVRTRDRQVPEPLRAFAEVCLRDGVDYGSLVGPEDAAVEFPWGDLTRHLQKVVRKLMKKPSRSRKEAADE